MIWKAMRRLGAAFVRTGTRRGEQAERRAPGDAGSLFSETEQLLLEHVNDAVIAIDTGFTVLSWNRAAEQIYGWSASEVIGQSLLEIIPVLRFQGGQFHEEVLAAIYGRGRWAGEVVQRHRDGHELVIDGAAQIMHTQSGRLDVIVAINRDITERKRGEAEQRLSEARNRALLAAVPDMIFRISAEGEYLDFEANDTDRLYVPPATIIGKNVREILPPDVADACCEAMARSLTTGQIQVAEYRLQMPDGLRDFEARMVTGGPREVLSIVRDVTERKRAEEALQQSEERFRQLAENIREVFWVADARTMRRIYVSPAYEEIWGRTRESLIDDKDLLLETIHPEDRERIRAAQERQREGDYDEEYRIVRPDGEIRWIWARAFPIRNRQGEVYRIAGIAEDITARKHAEQERLLFERQLLETQRLESLGVLAGGIAHDFNNLMAVILGNASLALMSLPPDAAVRPALETIKTTAQQGAELPRQMLAYTGKGPSVKEQVNLAVLVSEMERLLKASVTKNVRLRCELAAEVPAIDADPTQLRQVVMNLTSNASEAIGAEQGTITLAIDAVRQGAAEPSQAYLGVPPTAGEYVRLRVADTGTGMDAATRARIFDPFFTTKFIGRGVGLPAVLGIVRSNHGALAVESEPGAGTTVTVLLPAARASAELPPTPKPADRQTVLVVDDEEGVREVLAGLLRHFGFDVLVAADGRTAVDTFREHAADICCVLLDASMPGMSGTETFHAIRGCDRDTPVIFMSGYDERKIRPSCRGDEPTDFLAKPFSAAALHAAVMAAVAPVAAATTDQEPNADG